MVHERPEVAGKLWFVARGVERLVEWSGGSQIAWNCLECTRISNPNRKPTPHEVRCEAWMSIVHGSRGLIYFVHQFKPMFREAALLDDAEMLEAVTVLNREIAQLAPVLNSPELRKSEFGTSKSEGVETDNQSVPIAVMIKRHEGATYVLAVAMRDGSTTATFSVKPSKDDKAVEVIGEKRTLVARNGSFKDHFGPWDVHLYRIAP